MDEWELKGTFMTILSGLKFQVNFVCLKFLNVKALYKLSVKKPFFNDFIKL